MALTETARARSAVSSRDSLLAFAASPWALVAVLLVTAIAYAPALAGWFEGDDFWFLRGAQAHGVWSYTLDSFDPRLTDPSNEFNRYRPLYPIVWHWQYEIFGMHAFPYHAVVLAAHLGCCVLVWWIARRLLRPDWTSALATAIFALHPVNAGTISWISGNRVFSTLPFLAAFLLFARFLERERESRRLEYVGSVLLYLVAVLMHSSTVVLLPVLVAYGFGIAGEPRDARQASRWLPYVPFTLVAAGVGITQLYVRQHLEFNEEFKFGWHQYTVYAQYLALLLTPPEPGEFHGRLSDVLSLMRGMSTLAILTAIVVAIAVRPMRRVTLFAAFWMLIAMLPDSTLLFVVSGRVLYLPSAAFAIFAVALLIWALETARRASLDIRLPLAVLGVAAAIAALALTIHRADRVRDNSIESRNYARALRDDGPDVPAGGILYLDNLPTSLRFVPTWATSLAALYYPDHEIRRLNASSRPGPNDRVFRYER